MVVRLPRSLRDHDPQVLAPIAGLIYLVDDEPGYGRRRQGRGFTYLDADGRRVTGEERERLVELAVPPAWADVWLSPVADGYLLATGIDDAGRKQYQYHDRFRAFCEQRKFERLQYFSRALVLLRKASAAGMEGETGTRPKAVAAALRLLDVGLVRVGNEASAADGSHGATTLHADHIVDDGDIMLEYTAKGGKRREIVIEDDQMADVLTELAGAEAERLFWFRDAVTGEERRVTAADVNATIVEIAGAGFTAKDYRTWGGSRVALEARVEGADAIEAADAAAEALGNTRAIARASYVHPLVLNTDDALLDEVWGRFRTSTWASRADSALRKLLTRRE